MNTFANPPAPIDLRKAQDSLPLDFVYDPDDMELDYTTPAPGDNNAFAPSQMNLPK